MLHYISVEPVADADHNRGHVMPFHSDMIFQYNKSNINAAFFQSEADSAAEKDKDGKGGSGGKDSPESTHANQMIDVFMTPQSEDEDLSNDGMSPVETFASPPEVNGFQSLAT